MLYLETFGSLVPTRWKPEHGELPSTNLPEKTTKNQSCSTHVRSDIFHQREVRDKAATASHDRMNVKSQTDNVSIVKRKYMQWKSRSSHELKLKW